MPRKLILAVLLVLGALPLLVSSPALAGEAVTCAEKEQIIAYKLKQAELYGNQRKVRGLNKALAEVRNWCSEESLLADAEEEVLEKMEDLRECERELAEAVSLGKSKKIAKRQRKLVEARQELTEAKAHRDAVLKAQGR